MPDPTLPSPELITEVVADPFDKLKQDRVAMRDVPFFGDILVSSNDAGICWAVAMSEAVGSLENKPSIDILTMIGAFVKGIKIPVDETEAEQFFVDFPAFRSMRNNGVKFLVGNDGGLSRRLTKNDPNGMSNIISYVLLMQLYLFQRFEVQ